MKARNVKEQAEQGKKLVGGTNADLWSDELNQFYDICIGNNNKANGFAITVHTAFLMGVAVGARAQKRKERAKV